jgi:hypothetical protein
MGREVRRVPPDWKHPTGLLGAYIPLFDGNDLHKRIAEWDVGAEQWAQGLRNDFNGGWVAIRGDQENMSFGDWYGERPNPKDYMPEWAPEQSTHYMMYENTSEGTPISPAFATPEELACWLADTGASAFGHITASYEAWLEIAKGGYAPGAVYSPERGFQSGVQAGYEMSHQGD